MYFIYNVILTCGSPLFKDQNIILQVPDDFLIPTRHVAKAIMYIVLNKWIEEQMQNKKSFMNYNLSIENTKHMCILMNMYQARLDCFMVGHLSHVGVSI